MRLFYLVMIVGLLPSAFLQGESPFDLATRQREAARQKAFDRGQKTALPAAEQREKIAGQAEAGRNAPRSADAQVVDQGAPSSNVYNRVMEMERHLKAPEDSISNANDIFINHPTATKLYNKEAERLYPDILRPDSAFAMRHAAISRWVDARQPPLAKDSRRKLLIAHMVSLEQTGRLHEDEHHIGRNVSSAQPVLKAPAFLGWSTFEITIDENQARLPDGGTGSFTAGVFGGPDSITWSHAGVNQTIKIPLATKGISVLPQNKKKKYIRQETLKQGWRFTFLP